MNPCPLHGDHSYDLLGAAQTTVLGVVTARRADSVNDANLLISGYLSEAVAAGFPVNTAWALLFSAATLWLDALIDCRAAHHEEDPAQTLQEMALALAAVR